MPPQTTERPRGAARAAGLALVAALGLAPEPASGARAAREGGLELVFRSGFEPGTALITPSAAWWDLVGADLSVAAPNDWVLDLDGHPQVGDFELDLKVGSPAQRKAEIVQHPAGPFAGHVLSFWLQYPHEPSSSGLKGRVQANLSGLTGVREVRHSVRMYLGPGFDLLREYPGSFTWLSLFEYWNDPDWNGSAAPFRVTVDVAKTQAAPGTPLSFRAKGQIMGPGPTSIVWVRNNLDVELPVGEWVAVELHYVEGGAADGRFTMTLVREETTLPGPFQVAPFRRAEVVFDVHDATRHPLDPTPDDGLPFFNPLKLYTSDELVDFVREQGGVLEVLWDDLELRFGP